MGISYIVFWIDIKNVENPQQHGESPCWWGWVKMKISWRFSGHEMDLWNHKVQFTTYTSVIWKHEHNSSLLSVCVCVLFPQPYDSLPTSQTCFFQLRLPPYSNQAVMAERLRYAINNCRSIDMDNYMLSRNVDNAEGSDTDYWCTKKHIESQEWAGMHGLTWTPHKLRDASSSLHQL